MTPWKDTGNSRRKAVGEATDKEARGVYKTGQRMGVRFSPPMLS